MDGRTEPVQRPHGIRASQRGVGHEAPVTKHLEYSTTSGESGRSEVAQAQVRCSRMGVGVPPSFSLVWVRCALNACPLPRRLSQSSEVPQIEPRS